MHPKSGDPEPTLFIRLPAHEKRRPPPPTMRLPAASPILPICVGAEPPPGTSPRFTFQASPPSAPPKIPFNHQPTVALTLLCVIVGLAVTALLVRSPVGVREEPPVMVGRVVPDEGVEAVEPGSQEETGIAVVVLAREEPRRGRSRGAGLPEPLPLRPAPRTGDLRVRLTDDTHVTGVEVTCDAPAYRARVPLDAGRVAVVPQVPAAAPCTLHFKGLPARFGPVTGGSNLDCWFQSSTAVCQGV